MEVFDRFGIVLGIRLIKQLNRTAKRCRNFDFIMFIHLFKITFVYIRLNVFPILLFDSILKYNVQLKLYNSLAG